MMPLENQGPIERIADLRRQLDELKTRQTIGSDSTLAYLTSSGAAYDRSGTIVNAGDKMTMGFSFTASKQAFSLSVLDISVDIGAPGTPAAFYDDYVYNIRPRVPNKSLPLLSQWTVDVYKRGSGTKTFYVRAHVVATDTGVVS